MYKMKPLSIAIQLLCIIFHCQIVFPSKNTQQEMLWTFEGEEINLSDFLNQHPGGKIVLENTRGRDITPYIYAHHKLQTIKNIQKKYSKHTQGDDKFMIHDPILKNLKEKIEKKLNKNFKPKPITWIFTFFVIFLNIFGWIFVGKENSIFSSTLILTSITQFLITGLGHNFCHQTNIYSNTRWFGYLTNWSDLPLNWWNPQHTCDHHMHINHPEFDWFLLEGLKLFNVNFGPFKSTKILRTIFYPLISGPCAQFKILTYPGSWPSFLIQLYLISSQEISFMQSFLKFFLIRSLATGWFHFIAYTNHNQPQCFPYNQHQTWSENQIQCSIDIGIPKFFDNEFEFFIISSFFGFLNSHVAHHLFPNLDASHFYEVNKILENENLKNHLNYQKTPFFEMVFKMWYTIHNEKYEKSRLTLSSFCLDF